MILQAVDLLWSLCSQTSLLVIICICSRSLVPASPPQLHLRSSAIRFSWGGQSLDPLPVQFTVGFSILWESNANADLTGGRAQVVMWATGSSWKYWWSFAHLPHLPPAVWPQSMPGGWGPLLLRMKEVERVLNWVGPCSSSCKAGLSWDKQCVFILVI